MCVPMAFFAPRSSISPTTRSRTLAVRKLVNVCCYQRECRAELLTRHFRSRRSFHLTERSKSNTSSGNEEKLVDNYQRATKPRSSGTAQTKQVAFVDRWFNEPFQRRLIRAIDRVLDGIEDAWAVIQPSFTGTIIKSLRWHLIALKITRVFSHWLPCVIEPLSRTVRSLMMRKLIYCDTHPSLSTRSFSSDFALPP